MKTGSIKNDVVNYLMVATGAVLYTVAIILFVTPQGFYTGGVMGICQLLRTILVNYVGLNIPEEFDISGVIYYAANVPLFVMAFKEISRTFFLKTLLATTVTTGLISAIPAQGMLLEDPLTSCIIGGILAGLGIGFMLRYGGSGGGLDIVGMYVTKKYRSASVGKVSIACNIVLYLICAVLFSIETAIYSIIYSAVSSITLDRVHYQNIMIKAMIFTKSDEVAEPIMKELGRGVTEWDGTGAYTGERERVLVSVISKYEMGHLKKIVLSKDPHAFITYSRVDSLTGNFIKKL